jgi:hypothetical protein
MVPVHLNLVQTYRACDHACSKLIKEEEIAATRFKTFNFQLIYTSYIWEKMILIIIWT